MEQMKAALATAGFELAGPIDGGLAYHNRGHVGQVVFLFPDRWEHQNMGDMRDEDGDGITHRGVGLASLEALLRDLAS